MSRAVTATERAARAAERTHRRQVAMSVWANDAGRANLDDTRRAAEQARAEANAEKNLKKISAELGIDKPAKVPDEPTAGAAPKVGAAPKKSGGRKPRRRSTPGGRIGRSVKRATVGEPTERVAETIDSGSAGAWSVIGATLVLILVYRAVSHARETGGLFGTIETGVRWVVYPKPAFPEKWAAAPAANRATPKRMAK